MIEQKTTKAELQQIVTEQQEQLSLMEKMLINKTDRTNELHVTLLEEQAKKRPILDANLWLGLKIGLWIGAATTGIAFCLGLLF